MVQMTQGNTHFDDKISGFQETDKFKSESKVSPVDKNGYYLFPVLQENSCNVARVTSNKQGCPESSRAPLSGKLEDAITWTSNKPTKHS